MSQANVGSPSMVMLWSRFARLLDGDRLNSDIESYDPTPPPFTMSRGGWPADSGYGRAFRASVQPILNTGHALINDPIPLPTNAGHPTEDALIGWQYFESITQIPVQHLEPYGGALPISEQPTLPIDLPWNEAEPSLLGK
jgi:hypothetical protein